MRISDWSSDVCSSDLRKSLLKSTDSVHLPGQPLILREQVGKMDRARHYGSRDNFQAKCLAMDDEADMLAIRIRENARIEAANVRGIGRGRRCRRDQQHAHIDARSRSDEHTSELQSLMRISY